MMQIHKSLKELIKFGIVGVANTLLDMAIYFLLTMYFGMINYAAQTISYLISMVQSYFVNRYWTFGRKGAIKTASEPVKFLIVNLISLGMSYLCFYLIGFWTQGLSIAENSKIVIEKLIVTPIVMIVNFILNKIWVFRGDEPFNNK